MGALVRASIQARTNLAATSTQLLGESHPLTRKIFAGFLKCFDEQLDWSLDDIPSEHLAYRARLLGD